MLRCFLQEYRKWYLRYSCPENNFHYKVGKSIVSALLFILSYFLSFEITKSFTKLYYGVPLLFCNPFQFETKKKKERNFCTYDDFAVTGIKILECKTIVSATCDTLAVKAMTKYLVREKCTYDVN